MSKFSYVVVDMLKWSIIGVFSSCADANAERDKLTMRDMYAIVNSTKPDVPDFQLGIHSDDFLSDEEYKFRLSMLKHQIQQNAEGRGVCGSYFWGTQAVHRYYVYGFEHEKPTPVQLPDINVYRQSFPSTLKRILNPE